jgi:hypothetical protein
MNHELQRSFARFGWVLGLSSVVAGLLIGLPTEGPGRSRSNAGTGVVIAVNGVGIGALLVALGRLGRSGRESR